MTELMDAFYTCIGKTFVKGILEGDGEYLVRTSRQDEELERLTAGLNQDVTLRIHDLLAEQLVIGELRECAYFRAGFRMALELTR